MYGVRGVMYGAGPKRCCGDFGRKGRIEVRFRSKCWGAIFGRGLRNEVRDLSKVRVGGCWKRSTGLVRNDGRFWSKKCPMTLTSCESLLRKGSGFGRMGWNEVRFRAKSVKPWTISTPQGSGLSDGLIDMKARMRRAAHARGAPAMRGIFGRKPYFVLDGAEGSGGVGVAELPPSLAFHHAELVLPLPRHQLEVVIGQGL